MDADGDLAPAEFGCCLLVRKPSYYKREDLPFTGRKPRVTLLQGGQFGPLLAQLSIELDACNQ